ncbi:MAG: hypothetical protein M5U28_45905 [Sandaracinaceae bacterium]|nr:hypothetical protein [Sandaracinaceae bacterium]
MTATTMDGRTLKRKKRLLKELQEGRRGETLKAHEVLGHVTELMTLGENLTTIRQLKPRVPATPAHTPEFLDAVRSTQRSYNYDARAWRILGINIDAVMAGGSSTEGEGGGGRRRRSARKKKAS